MSTSLKMSQGYEVLKPKSDKAFPIPCNEWDVLKEQLEFAELPCRKQEIAHLFIVSSTSSGS